RDVGMDELVVHGYFLNIASMRRVTMNPPAMLMVANNVAAIASHDDVSSRCALDSRPPTTMMPLIALVTLISGVWSAGVTFHTTWNPTNTAITNTVRCWNRSSVSGSAAPATLPRPNRRNSQNAASTTPSVAIAMPPAFVGAAAGGP